MCVLLKIPDYISQCCHGLDLTGESQRRTLGWKKAEDTYSNSLEKTPHHISYQTFIRENDHLGQGSLFMCFSELVPFPESGSQVSPSTNRSALKAFTVVGRPRHKVQFGLTLVTVFS